MAENDTDHHQMMRHHEDHGDDRWEGRNREEPGEGAAPAAPAGAAEQAVIQHDPPQLDMAAAEVLQEQLQPPPPNISNIITTEEVLYPGDPRRMRLSNEEIQWAIAIKKAVAGIPELDPLSDYMCAQLAIVEKDNLFGAIAAARALQTLREEYHFIDSYEMAVAGLRKVVQANPRKFLLFCFSTNERRYVLAHDTCQRVSDAEDLQTYMAGAYYLYQTMSMDFESIRQGIIVLVECEGYDWRQKRSWIFAKKMFMELIYYYPLRGEFRHFHNGMIFNIWASILKKLLPDRLARSFYSGCRMDSSLRELFLVPTPEDANARLMERMRIALELRYWHEKSFSLPS